MNIIHLQRIWENDKQTGGVGTIRDEKTFKALMEFRTLELSWVDDNEDGISDRMVSRIPAGGYEMVQRYSEKYKRHLHIKNVPGRSFILIHPGNYHWHTKGCILVGSDFSDINADGFLDVINSKQTMKRILELITTDSRIFIEDKFDFYDTMGPVHI